MPVCFFEVPSGESGKWGCVLTYGDVDWVVVAKVGIVGGCPGTGWGEGWGCGGDVRCCVVVGEPASWVGVSACVECDQVQI